MPRTEHRRPLSAALGGIAFSVLTLAAVIVANTPGGNYSGSQVAAYLASGHRVPAIAALYFGMLGLLGLVFLLSYLREQLPSPRTAQVVWGMGGAAVACFAIGEGVASGQVIAHLEGGRSIAVSPAATYLISEIGVVFVFGCGAILLGLALIVLALNASEIFPSWLRWLTLLCGIAGVAGLAFFTFFLLLVSGIAIGGWLLASGRKTALPATVTDVR